MIRRAIPHATAGAADLVGRVGCTLTCVKPFDSGLMARVCCPGNTLGQDRNWQFRQGGDRVR